MWNNGKQRTTWFKSLMVHTFSNDSNVLISVVGCDAVFVVVKPQSKPNAS